MTSYEEMNEILKELGDAKDAVISNLKELGIKGEISNPYCCPIANYLKSKNVYKPIVNFFGLTIMWGSTGHCIPTPKYLVEVIKSLDNQEYPELIEFRDRAIFYCYEVS